MPVRTDGPCPYAPPAAILSIVERFRNRGLQTPITKDVLQRAGVTESLAPRTFAAFVQLDLLDDEGYPTDLFERIARATETELPELLSGWLHEAYEDVFKFVDPAEDDDTRIRDAFRGYTPRGQQGRMVTLFMGLCEAAGLAGAGPSAGKESSASTPKKSRAVHARGNSSNAHTTTRTRRSSWGRENLTPVPTSVPMGLRPLITLVESLSAHQEGWTIAEKNGYMAAFEALIDYFIPLVESNETHITELVPPSDAPAQPN